MKVCQKLMEIFNRFENFLWNTYNFQILKFYNYRKMLNEVFENEFLISVRLA